MYRYALRNMFAEAMMPYSQVVIKNRYGILNQFDSTWSLLNISLIIFSTSNQMNGQNLEENTNIIFCILPIYHS